MNLLNLLVGCYIVKNGEDPILVNVTQEKGIELDEIG